MSIQQKISKEHSDRTKTVAGRELRFRYGGIDIRETLLGVLSCIKGTARVSEGSPGIDEEKKGRQQLSAQNHGGVLRHREDRLGQANPFCKEEKWEAPLFPATRPRPLS